jgi:hypothetical protein
MACRSNGVPGRVAAAVQQLGEPTTGSPFSVHADRGGFGRLWVARSLRGGGNLCNEAGQMTTAIEVGSGTLIKLAAAAVLMITIVVAAWTANRQ